ncbi:DUF4956 domain-containing protein [Thalassospira sp. HF15]|uniref:DUF4956 domain-containing protein n=1 Tax=Thalassospira sp. HF15 TaxID=2722755 RepID=UPI00142F8EF8|nr:DUF4956 domain-containing protein [Thalassospira sp. HF15]NIY75181.1 DUF4956 domain-containing protein [Thalassospira sp. HF15]
MDELIRESLGDFNIITTIAVIDVIFSIVAASFLNIVLAKFYIMTHGGYSYSRSFVHSIVLVGVTISLIMIIIGSNIARAFALVGAMSIVRFRNPVKDSRDLVFIFAAIAVGMACGTQFYQFAAIFVFVFCLLLLGFKFFRFGDLAHMGYVIKLHMKTQDRPMLNETLHEFASQYNIIAVEKMQRGEGMESVIVELELKRKVIHQDLLSAIEERVNPESVSILVGEGNVSA